MPTERAGLGMRALWWIFAFCLLAGPARARELIIERAWLEDAAGTLRLADVVQRDFTVYSGPLQRGFSPSVFWVRLKVDGAPCEQALGSACADRWVLRLQPANLDEISVFDSLDPGRPAGVVGDRHPASGQRYVSLNNNLLLPSSTQPRTLWLRLQTSNTKLMDVELLSFDEALRRDQLQSIATSLLVCWLALFMAWATLSWLARREHLIGVMALDQLVTLLYALAYLGFLRLLIGDRVPAVWLDQLTNLLILSAAPAQLWFHREFLREMNAPAAGLRLLTALQCLYPFELAGLAFGFTRQTLQFNSSLVVLIPLALLATAWFSGRRRDGEAAAPLFSRNALLLLYAPMLALLWLSILPILGLVGLRRMTVYSLPFYGFLNGLVLVVILQLRHRRQQALHAQTTMHLQLAQQRVDSEVQQRRQQAQFMDMLTHELKTPLAVLRMSLGMSSAAEGVKQRADRAIQDMAAVIDRCALAAAVEDQGAAASRAECDLRRLLDGVIAGLDGGDRIRRPPPVDGVDPVATLRTDLSLCRSVLGNLLDNALKYAPPGSPVTIELDARPSQGLPGVSIAVANLPGQAGWPEAERVFQRYYRSAAARHQSGSGLGLYLAGTLAQRLGGSLRYAPDSTHVRFELWLPL